MSNVTEIICVMDRSGSMDVMRDQAISSFNEFLETQKKAKGKALFTLTLFNTEYELRHSGKDLQKIPSLTHDTYIPGGMTALLDAVGKTIDEVGERLRNTKKASRPKQVVFLIITDGYENSSKEYGTEQVAKMIKQQQEKYSWEFVFLAAGEDALRESADLGIQGKNVVAFAQTGKAYASSVQSLSSNVVAYRSVGAKGVNWQDDHTTKK